MGYRDNRVRIDINILQKLIDELQQEIQKEINHVPTSSLIVNIALLKYIAMKENIEIEIKIDRYGKLVYKFV